MPPIGQLRRQRLRSSTRRRARAQRRAAAAPQRHRARARGARARRAGSRKRYRGVSFDRPPVHRHRARRARRSREVRALRARHRRATSTRAAGCGSRATSAPARRRSRCSSPRPRSRPAARSRSTRCRGCWPIRDDLRRRRGRSLHRPARPPGRGRPAAHRRRRRREDAPTWVLEQLYSIVNARYEDAALDHRHDEPRRRDAAAPSRSASARSRAWTRCASDPLPLFGARPARARRSRAGSRRATRRLDERAPSLDCTRACQAS